MSTIRRTFLKAGEAQPRYMGLNVVNKTGSTLSAGALVYVSGYDTTTGFFKVSKADADVSGALPTWVLAESVADGYTTVAVAGYTLTGVNTSGGAVGDLVYADATTAGGWTLTAPTGGAVSVIPVGRIRAVSATEGEIEFDLVSHERAVKLGNLLLQAGVLTADATGRALMASGFFDASTANAKFAANAFDNNFCTNVFANGAIPTGKLQETLLRYNAVSLTNSQIKNLRATPVELVPAPGAGKFIEFVSAVPLLDYGTNALTRPNGDEDLVVRYENGSGPQASVPSDTGLMTSTSDSTVVLAKASGGVFSKSAVENKALVLHNKGTGEFGGNAANDTTLRIKVTYRVHTTGW